MKKISLKEYQNWLLERFQQQPMGTIFTLTYREAHIVVAKICKNRVIVLNDAFCGDFDSAGEMRDFTDPELKQGLLPFALVAPKNIREIYEVKCN